MSIDEVYKINTNTPEEAPTLKKALSSIAEQAVGQEFYDKATVSGTGVAFVDSNPDTITDTGSGFGDFRSGQTIAVSGSASNDGAYTVASVSAGTLTLITTDALVAEGAGASVTVSVVPEVATGKVVVDNTSNKVYFRTGTGRIGYVTLTMVT